MGFLVLAFVHPWREARRFKWLFYGAGLAFAGFVIVHNVFDAASGAVAGAAVIEPAGVMGLVGMAVMFVRERLA